MKLTREELAEMRARSGLMYGATREDVRTLLDFATEMLPVRDALLRALAAEEKRDAIVDSCVRTPESQTIADQAVDEHLAIENAFWTLAHELAEADASKGADDV